MLSLSLAVGVWGSSLWRSDAVRLMSTVVPIIARSKLGASLIIECGATSEMWSWINPIFGKIHCASIYSRAQRGIPE